MANVDQCFPACLIFIVLLVSTAQGQSYPEEYFRLKSIVVITENGTRQITVMYNAGSEPSVLWAADHDSITSKGNAFQIINRFSESEGAATVTMPVGHFWSDPNINITVSFSFEDNWATLLLRSGDVLMNSIIFEEYKPVSFNIVPGGTMDFAAGEQVEMTISVEAEDLHSYWLHRASCSMLSLDYGVIPPERIVQFAIESKDTSVMDERSKKLVMSRQFQGNQTYRYTVAKLNTSFEHTEGILDFDVKLVAKPEHKILKALFLRRAIYVKQYGHSAPFRENSLTYITTSILYSTYEEISRHRPYFYVYAIGNPKPDIKLYRGCQELTEPAVKKYNSGSRFRADVRFEFTNVSEALEGVYQTVATSGTMALRDTVSVKTKWL